MEQSKIIDTLETYQSTDQLVCLWGKGRPSMARPGGVLLPLGVGFPPFPSWTRREGRGEREEGKGGAPPPFLVQFGLEGEGARGLPWPPLLFANRAHEAQ